MANELGERKASDHFTPGLCRIGAALPKTDGEPPDRRIRSPEGGGPREIPRAEAAPHASIAPRHEWLPTGGRPRHATGASDERRPETSCLDAVAAGAARSVIESPARRQGCQQRMSTPLVAAIHLAEHCQRGSRLALGVLGPAEMTQSFARPTWHRTARGRMPHPSASLSARRYESSALSGWHRSGCCAISPSR